MKKTLFILLGIAIIIQSCDSDNFKFETDKISDTFKHSSSWALPLVNAKVTLGELLPDDDETKSHIVIAEDGFITMVTDSHLRTIKAKDFLADNLPPVLNDVEIVPIKFVVPVQHHVPAKDFFTGLNKMESAKGFYCANPQIELYIKNYWPVPLRLKFEETYYYKEENSTPIPITGEGVTMWHNIKVPESTGSSAITRIDLNGLNSNFDTVIAELPHHVSFGAYMELQDDVLPTTTYNIPINTSDSIYVHVKVPLEVKMTNVSLKDTVDLDIGSDMDEDKKDIVQYIKLNMLFNNNFPIKTDLKLYLADDLYQITDSINDNDISIDAGNSEPGKSKEVVIFDNEKIRSLLNAKHLIFKLRLDSEGKTVKLYNTNSLDVKLGALVKLKYEN